ncbi:MAG: EAL domain-containing protein [Cyanobacterium sp. T60_A2020_053]|nr:EAL domain-containing protein [Cyanobacterium sp. T60_A2020_053]
MTSNILKNLVIYRLISRLQRPKSYLGKIMLVAFLGTHIPLLALFFYSISVTNLELSAKIQVLIVALIATLIGTGITLFMLQQLLIPISVTAKGIREYLETQKKPKLPNEFKDEAGILMADAQYAITKLDELIEQLKNYNPITSLPNNELFQLKLNQFLKDSYQVDKTIAIILVNINGLQEINSIFSYDTGNLVLRQVGQEISNWISKDEFLAQINSNEFAIIYNQLISIEELEKFTKNILNAVNQRIVIDNEEITVNATAGIAISPDQENAIDNPLKLVDQAGVALNSVQRQNSYGYNFYSPEINEQLKRKFQLERDLGKAIAREELELFYQPQIDSISGSFTGAEALIRWHHHDHGFVSPAEFIPIAEKSNLILDIGDWVLKNACQQNKIWTKDGFPELCVAINLSGKQFEQIDLVERVQRALLDNDLKTSQLELEITEGLLINDVEKAINLLTEMRKLGLMTALDDFGTGFSSLSYLKRFALNYLKIDQSFVRGIPDDSSDIAIVKSIIALAHSLQMKVVAEGVETLAQADFLLHHGCNKLQGYYFSRPINAQDFTILWEKKLDNG